MAELTATDVIEMTKHNGHYGATTTGIGLAAGLGGGALLLAIGLGWGINQASKARAKAAEAAAEGNKSSIDMLTQLYAAERTSRESWQNANAPSIRQYVDVQSSPSATSNPSVSAVADALAYASAVNNGGLSSAVGSDNYLRVMRYSAPKPCGCDSCGE